MESRTTKLWPACVANALLIICPVLWLVWPAVTGRHTFVFRDSGHFYYPLYEFIDSEWRAGRVSLWNPYDNLGQPLLANAPSAVFYPGKLIFLLPLDYAAKYNLYIVAHLFLAAAACFWCARQWSISRHGALLASLSYTLSGSVLSLYCNVIYLVGAAWMPLALWAAVRLCQGTSCRVSLIWGVSVALMVFGGDPQAAYHAALATALFGCLHWRRNRLIRGATSDSSKGRAASQPRMRRYLWLASLAVAIGLALSAVQILPSLEWARYSDRSIRVHPHTVWQLVEEMGTHFYRKSGDTSPGNGYAGIVGKLPQETYHAQDYQFSNGPWRFAELIWPNFGGCQSPVHRRWLNVLPAEGRVWTPSLYLGLLPLVMATSTWTRRTSQANVHYLWGLVTLFGLASLGRYGVGWLLQELSYAASGGSESGPAIGQPVGGVYWWMYILLPGYSVFRYPAKLFVVATLGLSLLAGYGWDAKQRDPYVVRRLLRCIRAFTLVTLAVVILLAPYWDRLLRDNVPTEALFGPFDSQTSWWDLTTALIQTLALCCVYGAAFRRGSQPASPPTGGRRWPMIANSGYALLLMTAVELVFAHSWIIQFAPSSTWRSPTALTAAAVHTKQSSLVGTRLVRSSNTSKYPSDWRLTSSRTRHADALCWDRETVYPNFHLQYPLRQTGTLGAAMPGDFRVLWSSIHHAGHPRWLRDAWLDALAINDFLTLDGNEPVPYSAKLESVAVKVGLSQTIRWSYHPQRLERVWVVPLDQVEWVTGGNMKLPGAADKLLRRMIETRRNGTSFREHPVVISSVPAVQGRLEAGQKSTIAQLPGRPNQVRIIRDEPDRIELQVDLSEPCLLVLADQYYPGWTLKVAADGTDNFQSVPILRTNLVMRGAILPCGKQNLLFEYRPKSFVIGSIISGLSWMGLLAGVGYTAANKLRRPTVSVGAGSAHQRMYGTRGPNDSAPSDS